VTGKVVFGIALLPRICRESYGLIRTCASGPLKQNTCDFEINFYFTPVKGIIKYCWDFFREGVLAATMPWIGRSGNSRMVTCLEATRLGYSFVSTCSKSDY